MRRIRGLDSADGRTLRRPYRDTALFYGALAAVIVGVAAATGGSLWRAIGIAVGFFVIATVYSWWRWRARKEVGRRR